MPIQKHLVYCDSFPERLLIDMDLFDMRFRGLFFLLNSAPRMAIAKRATEHVFDVQAIKRLRDDRENAGLMSAIH